MTLDETIKQLKELFQKRNEIDEQIGLIISQHSTSEKDKIRKRIKYQPKKDKNIKYPDPGAKRRYYCRDCKVVFESEIKKLDAICPECNSVHVDYASLHRK